MAPDYPSWAVEGLRQRLRDVNDRVSVFGVGPDQAESAYGTALEAAIQEYSRDRVRQVVADVPGNGTAFYDLADLPGWVEGWSRVLAVEYPAGTVGAGYTPANLDPAIDWTEYRDAISCYLRLLRYVPTIGETLRVTYTAPHTCLSGSDTVLIPDRQAVLDLAASYGCRMLATEAALSVDTTVQSESTNWRDAQGRLAEMEKRWRDAYYRAMSKAVAGEEGAVRPALAVRDFDTSPRGKPTRQWLTHAGRR